MQEVRIQVKRCNFPGYVDINCRLAAQTYWSTPGKHAQDYAAAPVAASFPYSSRPERPVAAIDTSSRVLKCRGTVPAQAACLVPGTPNCPSHAHRPRTFFFELVLSIKLKRGVDDCQPETLIGWHPKEFKLW